MTAEVMQKVQLVDGSFSPSEAQDLINGLIDEKINFHKIQRLCRYESDEKNPCSFQNDRLAELKEEKRSLKSIIEEARANGMQLKINGTLEIELIN